MKHPKSAATLDTSLKPGPRSAAFARGQKLLAKGEIRAAIGAFEEALREQPEDPAILFALGTTAARLDMPDAATLFYRRILARDPDCVEARVNLANVLRATEKREAAAEILREGLSREPGAAELWLTLGHTVREAGDSENAETFYREAIELNPRYAAALGSLADLLSDRGQEFEAMALYDKAARCAPSSPQLRLNRALLMLHRGRLEEGWRDYEWRLQCPGAPRRDHRLPRWTSGPLRNKRLLILAEQGIGDQILFASCLPGLTEKASLTVHVVECEPRLVPLFKRSFPWAEVAPAVIERQGGITRFHYKWLKDFGGADKVIEIASLPRRMRQHMSDFPNPHTYLRPDPQELTKWRRWLETRGPGPNIGICWRSGKTSGLRAQQFAPLDSWIAFARTLPAVPICMQYDVQPEELQTFAEAGVALAEPPDLDQRQEIDRATTLLAALDAVICAPTSVAVQAAAIGTPTFKILFDKSWTALGQHHEPFTPACRLARPKIAGAWTEAFAQAAEFVAGLTASGPSGLST